MRDRALHAKLRAWLVTFHPEAAEDFVPLGDIYSPNGEIASGPAEKFDRTTFADVLQELQALHDRKGQDYGRPGDSFANVRASEAFGIPAWVGALVRAHDKMIRLQRAAQGLPLANESTEDSLLDLATYAVIALILWRESREMG